jgi:phosphoribosylformimino-5-aminoimidazole carboxamide ribotide isomerase
VQLIPAIDLLDGKAVRLHQGRYDQVTVYDHDPAALAARYRGQCGRLHVVDLEGARAGRAIQTEMVQAIVAAFGPGVQVGGGIRSEEAAESYIALGAERIVLGTAAVGNPALVRALAARFSGRVVAAVDAKDGRVAVDGWEQVVQATALDVARALAGAPLSALLYTDIARDGTQVGPNLEATAELARSGGFPVIASGGVGSLAHLRSLARIPGVAGVIVGRALYEGTFTLAEAIEAAAVPPGA